MVVEGVVGVGVLVDGSAVPSAAPLPEHPVRLLRRATDDVPPVPAADGPLRPVVSVVDATGEATGELLVRVRGGRLVGLERPWWTDEAPTSWPGPDDLRPDGAG